MVRVQVLISKSNEKSEPIVPSSSCLSLVQLTLFFILYSLTSSLNKDLANLLATFHLFQSSLFWKPTTFKCEHLLSRDKA
jgi:hypothetical protein